MPQSSSESMNNKNKPRTYKSKQRVNARRVTAQKGSHPSAEHRTLFTAFQKKIGTQFSNEVLLYQAFTHSSYVNENRNFKCQDNERLEFLGDAVLELTVSKYLFLHFPKMSEGEMTKLRAAIVCEPSLVKLAEDLEFGPLILLGKGEEITGGRERPALLADVFESFVGALYLDQGIDAVYRFLSVFVFPKIDAGIFTQVVDYKSQLQEFVQHDGLGEIQYRIIEEKGPAHNREFVSEVFIKDQPYGLGIGRSKKEAEQKAAHKALKQLGAM